MTETLHPFPIERSNIPITSAIAMRIPGQVSLAVFVGVESRTLSFGPRKKASTVDTAAQIRAAACRAQNLSEVFMPMPL
jgi:hypothetical protein